MGLTELSRVRGLCLSRVTTRPSTGIIFRSIFSSAFIPSLFTFTLLLLKKSNGISKLWTFRFKIAVCIKPRGSRFILIGSGISEWKFLF